MNAAGGRDHWPQCFTVYFAGGGVRGGQAIGRSDAIAGQPKERPVHPTELLASIYYSLGPSPTSRWIGPHGDERPLVPFGVESVWELFATG